MTKWREEVEELHELFEAYFRGTSNSLDRVEAALGADFTIVGPDGVASSREQTMKALQQGHGHAAELAITVTEPTLLVETESVVVASYVENHQMPERSNHRLSTVVFSRDDHAPNGLLWRRVHETWIS